MIETLIELLIAVLIFGIIALGLDWVCRKFFPEFPPIRWICGAICLIILLVWALHYVGAGPAPMHRWS